MTQRTVTGTSAREWVALAIGGVLGTGALTWFLATQTPSTVPFWDAVTTALSLLAVYGQAKKRWESWFLWMAADVVYVPLYLYKGLDLTAILYIGFFLLCVKGLVEWRRDLHSRAGSPVAETLASGTLAATQPGGVR